MGVIDLGELGVLPCEHIRTVRYRRDDLHSHGLAKDLSDFVSDLEKAYQDHGRKITSDMCSSLATKRGLLLF